MDILTEIVGHTQSVVAQRRARTPLSNLRELMRANPRDPISLAQKLLEPKPHIIAEFKRKSPSKPKINPNADPVRVAATYLNGGASAISVLTEPGFFAGSPEDLKQIRSHAPDLPLLRKDFTIDAYQIDEAKAMGADLILLIARILDKPTIAEFCERAHDLGLEVLCEIHDAGELDKVGAAAIDFLGVNCRDLKSFGTDLERLEETAEQLPAHVPWVAESGIRTPEDVARLYGKGYRAFLVGESLMRSPDPECLLHQLGNP